LGFKESLLNGVQHLFTIIPDDSKAFDGSDFFASDCGCRSQARAGWFAIDQDSARTADPGSTAIFRSG